MSGDPYRKSGSRDGGRPASSPSSEPAPRRRRQTRPKETYSAIPARNFTLSSGERIRALVAGPPAFALRRRRIEDLEARIIAKLRAMAERDGVFPDRLPPLVERDRGQLNRWVADHNQYYPIEANLPIDPATGGRMDGSAPFVPMVEYTAEALLSAARDTREESDDDAEPAASG